MGKTEDALESYYSVIAKNYAPEQKENHDIEWFWFYRCGFQALSLLEAEKRWDAAVKLARRIASFNGPRAEEASKRANTLAKQHMIWEDDPPTASSNP
jgi:predicted phosphoadenosine phosphosulfate sulfurtransferase